MRLETLRRDDAGEPPAEPPAPTAVAPAAAPEVPPEPRTELRAGAARTARAGARPPRPSRSRLRRPRCLRRRRCRRTGWFNRLATGLSRSSRELTSNIAGVFTKRRLDQDTLHDLEDVLIQADLGIETALRITDALAPGRFGRDVSEDEVRSHPGRARSRRC